MGHTDGELPGSTGYGQAFTDAVFADQNGNEARMSSMA
jgi:dipeptidyl aminopeptidase/acylaminoacyl peptidase